MFDATNVVLTVKRHETEGLVKLGFYLLCFFYYLYRFAPAASAHAHRSARMLSAPAQSRMILGLLEA
jgi:hypothetical protein